MFKVVAEVAALVLFALALVGFFSTTGAKVKFLLVGVIAALSFFAVKQVEAGHELVTLLGTTILMIADLVWFANTYAAAHGTSLFGWLQGHKTDANLKAEVQAAGVAAVADLKADASVAQGAATAVAAQAVGAVASTAATAVKDGVEQAVASKL